MLLLVDAIFGAQLGDEAVGETALRALYGLLLDDEDLAIFQRATGRDAYEPREYCEATFICGRRSVKSSKLAANVAIFEACFRQHELARGEGGYVVALAPTQGQAGVVFEYILSRLAGSPTLPRLINGEPRADEVDLTNGIAIAVWPASFRSIRGISIVCAIADEIAFWHDDVTGANPASEMLVWKLDTPTMNPSLSAAFLAEEEKRDPESSPENTAPSSTRAPAPSYLLTPSSLASLPACTRYHRSRVCSITLP